MIVADASWVIALRDPQDALHDRAVASEIATDETVTILMHPVTLAECLIADARDNNAERSAAELRAAYKVCEVDLDAPVRWANLCARNTLRTPDAVVLDTALQHGADTIATFDAWAPSWPPEGSARTWPSSS